MIGWVAAAALSLGAIGAIEPSEERCQQDGDIFSCEAERTYATVERVQTEEGCVEKHWQITETKVSKRMWGDDDPFIENVKTTQKLKASRVVSKSCSAARAAGK
jgi:hypothetical protein